MSTAEVEAFVVEAGPRRAWQPVDLGPVLDGTYRAPLPTVGARSDGVGLFYPRRVHTAAGESGDRQDLFVMLAQVEVELRRGNAAVFVDFEDDEGGVVGRLLAMGAKPEAIRGPIRLPAPGGADRRARPPW